MNKVKLAIRYQNTLIYRASAVTLVLAPAAAASTKLQGMLFDESLISLLLIIGNVFAMTAVMLNKLSIRGLFWTGTSLSLVATLGSIAGYMMDMNPVYILTWGMALAPLGWLFTATGNEKIHNALKDIVGMGYDLAKFRAKKTSLMSATAIIGQMLALAFYTVVTVDPMIIILSVQFVATTIYTSVEFYRWKILKDLKVV